MAGIERVELLTSADPAQALLVRQRGRKPVVEGASANGIEGITFGTESSGVGSTIRLDSADPLLARAARFRGQRAVIVVDAGGTAIPMILAGSAFDADFVSARFYAPRTNWVRNNTMVGADVAGEYSATNLFPGFVGMSLNSGATTSIANSQLTVTNGAADFGSAQASFATTVGQRYVLRGTRVGVAGGASAGLDVHVSGAGFADLAANADIASPIYFVANSTTTTVILVVGGNTLGASKTFADVSVRAATNLILNGTFADTSAWLLKTPVGTETNTISGGTLNLTPDATNQAHADQSFSTVSGRSYTVSLDTNGNVGVLAATAQGGTGLLNVSTGAAVTGAAFTFTATSATTWLRLYRGAAGSAVTVDNVVVADAGVRPTNWTAFPSIIGASIVGLGTENGVNYLDLRFSGVPSSTSTQFFSFDTTALGLIGETWTVSAYLKLVAGSLTNLSSILLRHADEAGALALTPDGTLTRYQTTRVLTVASAVPRLRFNFANTTTAVDCTLRIGLPQNEQAYAATPAIPTSGSAVTVTDTQNTLASLFTTTRASDGYAEDLAGNWTLFAPNIARRTNKGLLVEEARTNGVRNNSMQGVIVGTTSPVPGTPVGTQGNFPTNWVGWSSPGSGMTTYLVGAGTENGIDYIDVRYHGTATATGSLRYAFEGNNVVAAASGQTWTNSFFAKLIAGTTSMLIHSEVREMLPPTAVATGSGTATALTSAWQRLTASRTFTDGTTTHAYSVIRTNIVNGESYDFVMRIGWPQLEQGAFATSPIRTTGSAATRAADLVSVPAGVIGYNATEGTLYGEAERQGASAGSWVSLDNGTGSEYINLAGALTDFGAYIAAGGAGQLTGNYRGSGMPNPGKGVVAYKANDAAWTSSGAGAVGTDTSVTLPAAATKLGIGTRGAGAVPLNGYVKRTAYFGTRRPNAELQALVT